MASGHRGHRSDHIGDRAEIDRFGRCCCRQPGGRLGDYRGWRDLWPGALNPISLAFAVLFVGLGADFAIQYAVRYRAERHDLGKLDEALIGSAAWVGIPSSPLRPERRRLDFWSFTPTAFRGLAQLGIIAGFGMVVAYVLSLTLLPALFALLFLRPEKLETADIASLGAGGRLPEAASNLGDPRSPFSSCSPVFQP